MEFPLQPNTIYKFIRENRHLPENTVFAREEGEVRTQLLHPNQLAAWRQVRYHDLEKNTVQVNHDLFIFTQYQNFTTGAPEMNVVVTSYSGSSRLFYWNPEKSTATRYYFDGFGKLERTGHAAENVLVWILETAGDGNVNAVITNHQGYEADSQFLYQRRVALCDPYLIAAAPPPCRV